MFARSSREPKRVFLPNNKKYRLYIEYKTNNTNIYNMSKKTQIEQGLNGLLATAAQQENEQDQEKGRKTETICYNLDPDIIENVRRIAKYEGKRANAVVTDALRMYFAQWKPVPQETPTLL